MDSYDDQIMLIVVFSYLRSVKNRFGHSGYEHAMAMILIV